jgi:NTE family protein
MRELFCCALLLLLPSFSAGQSLRPEQQARPSEDPPARSTSSEAKPRLKIGVALEGGGALGLAHIGVLQWFEDHHIPIDYIAGTSMGGLVGGLYATGKSPEQLKTLVEEQKWDLIIQGEIPFGDLTFRRKEDLIAYPNSIKLGLKHGLSLPSGLNTGHDISLLIDRETLPYSNLRSFDDLPIPFRCVATELVSGKEEVFSHGQLDQALRATMSLPGIFSPVREDDKIYVDGGLVGNLPTDVVRKMGADIVIGVHLEVAPGKASDIQSLPSVLGRSIEVVIRENEIRGMAGADLIVKVNLQDFTSMDYQKSLPIIAKGKEAAAEKAKVLAPYSLDNADWAAYIANRNSRRQTLVPIPQFVKVEGVDPLTEKSIERFLHPLVGKQIDTKSLDQLLTRLAGIGKFSSVGYRLGLVDDQEGLVITVTEKSYAPPILQLGFQVDGTQTDDVTYTQAARITVMDVAGFRSEWRTDFSFGNTYGIASELYKPLTAVSRWFAAPRAEVSQTAFRIYDKGNPRAEYRLRSGGGGADIGYGFSRFTEVRFGYEIGYIGALLRLGTPDFASHNGQASYGRVRFITDHTDSPVIPRSGYRIESNFRAFDHYPSATETIPALDARIEFFQPISRPASVFLIGSGGTTFGRNESGIPLYFIGGLSTLSAYGNNELSGEQFYAFRAGYLRDIFTLPPFVGKKVYAVAYYDFAKMYGDINESRFPNDVAAGVVTETFIGPLLIGGSLGDTGHRKWFFQLGRVF